MSVMDLPWYTDDLGMKSVSRIELAALLEEKLGVEIDNLETRTNPRPSPR